MQRLALLIVIIGIIFLATFIEISSPKFINSSKEISNLLQNQKIYVSGAVIKETQSNSNRIITLDNNVTLYCTCPNIPKLINRNIKAMGIIDTYQNSKIKVLKIKWQ